MATDEKVKNEKKRIIITLSTELQATLQMESIKRGLTKSVVIQLALEKYFQGE